MLYNDATFFVLFWLGCGRGEFQLLALFCIENIRIGIENLMGVCMYVGMIMGASAASVWYNLRVPHPCREVPILDYDLALLFQPMLMLGITLGVSLSVVFPYWLITVLIIILFLGNYSFINNFYKLLSC